MPRAARYKIAAIQDLLRQLEYAPAETRRRQMDAAEKLIADLDPDQNYPEDFIVYRITGYRPDRVDEPVTLVGQALLPDLVNLVQTLSEGLALPAEHGPRRAIPVEQLAARLKVSHKTIQRYRKQGLVCHYVMTADGVQRLACYNDALERFAASHRRKLDSAAAFGRIDPQAERTLIDLARALHEAEKLTLNETALRLARQVGRAHETIRLVLRRHDRRAPQPIFSEHGPLTDREAAIACRAWLRGVEPAPIARRFDKTRPTIHRAINRRRGDLLQSLGLAFIQLPTFDRPDAADVILAAPALTEAPPDDREFVIGHVLESTRFGEAEPAGGEDEIAAAFNFLKLRAATGIGRLGEWPGSGELDLIETDLRRVSILRRRLILIGLPAAVARIEHNLNRPLTHQSVDEIMALMKLAIDVVAHSVDAIDPSRGHRLDRVCRLAMDKALAKVVVPQASSRAAAKHAIGSLSIHDLLEALNPWDKWLSLRHDLRPHVPRLADNLQSVVTSRFGLRGMMPMTCRELAGQVGVSPVKAVRLLQQAIRELRRLARGE